MADPQRALEHLQAVSDDYRDHVRSTLPTAPRWIRPFTDAHMEILAAIYWHEHERNQENWGRLVRMTKYLEGVSFEQFRAIERWIEDEKP